MDPVAYSLQKHPHKMKVKESFLFQTEYNVHSAHQTEFICFSAFNNVTFIYTAHLQNPLCSVQGLSIIVPA